MEWLTFTLALVSAFAAIKTYRKSAQTKEAEFISQLHRSFFVESTYKKVREAIDNGPESASEVVNRLVVAEAADFTDFLNFFELATYFESCGILSPEAVETILAYYLNLFERNQKLRSYIQEPQNGFEYLNGYLNKRTSSGKD